MTAATTTVSIQGGEEYQIPKPPSYLQFFCPTTSVLHGALFNDCERVLGWVFCGLDSCVSGERSALWWCTDDSATTFEG